MKEYPILKFAKSFYCKELNEVIHAGAEQPKTKERFDILKKYAKIALEEKTGKNLDEMTARELREIASTMEIANYAKLKKEELVDAINAVREQVAGNESATENKEDSADIDINQDANTDADIPNIEVAG